MVGEVVGKSSGASFILERRLAAVGARADLVTEARRLYAEASKAGLGKLDSSGLLAMLEPKSLT
jgi:3-hydroxyisobutyrate dehydrogenase-like beta-hydroxyacid dehydrogenase